MNIQRNLAIMALLVLMAAILSACSFGVVVGSGRTTTETRAVSDFSAVDFAFIGDLAITQGNEESLTITGDDNIVPLIRTTVRDGVLHIDASPANIGRTVIPLRYELTVKELNAVSLSGLGNIEVDSLESPDVSLGLSGAGSLNVGNLLANNLGVNMSGLGSANLAGEVNKQAVNVSGAGSYYARDLRSQAAAVQISGLGSAEIQAVETLDASISGAGNIKYAGRPQVTQNISGLGSIEALGNDWFARSQP